MLGQHTQVRFDGQDIFVGLDVAMKSWKVAVYVGTQFFKHFSQPPRVAALVEYLKSHFPGARYHVVYEAGYFGFWIQREFTRLGVDCMVVNPADVPTTNKERRGKNDRVDAIKLGRSLVNGELHPLYVLGRENEEDRALVRTRMHFVRKQTRTKCQIKALLSQLGHRLPDGVTERYWSRAYVSWLEGLTFSASSGKAALDALLAELLSLRERIASVTKQIRSMTHEERYRRPAEVLQSVSGIGMLAAITFLTEVVDIRRFKNLDRLTSFVGLIPDEDSSGERERHTGITRRHNPMLRYILIECAWRSIQDDPSLMAAYRAYCVRMPANVAIVHVARKLLSRMRFVLINNTPYITGVAA